MVDRRLVQRGIVARFGRRIVLCACRDPLLELFDLIVGKRLRAKWHARLPFPFQIREDSAFLWRPRFERRTLASARREALKPGEIQSAIFHRGLMAALAVSLDNRNDVPKIADLGRRLLRHQAARAAHHQPTQANAFHYPSLCKHDVKRLETAPSIVPMIRKFAEISPAGSAVSRYSR